MCSSTVCGPALRCGSGAGGGDSGKGGEGAAWPLFVPRRRRRSPAEQVRKRFDSLGCDAGYAVGDARHPSRNGGGGSGGAVCLLAGGSRPRRPSILFRLRFTAREGGRRKPPKPCRGAVDGARRRRRREGRERRASRTADLVRELGASCAAPSRRGVSTRVSRSRRSSQTHEVPRQEVGFRPGGISRRSVHLGRRL
jgi:hypothetical protein